MTPTSRKRDKQQLMETPKSAESEADASATLTTVSGWDDDVDVAPQGHAAQETTVETANPVDTITHASLYTAEQLSAIQSSPVAAPIAEVIASIPKRVWVPALIVMALLLCVAAEIDAEQPETFQQHDVCRQ